MMQSARSEGVYEAQLRGARRGELPLDEALRLHQALEAAGQGQGAGASEGLVARLRAIPHGSPDEPTPFEAMCLAEMDGTATAQERDAVAAVCAAVPGFARRRAGLRACRLQPPMDVRYQGKALLRRGVVVWPRLLRHAGRVAAAVAIVALAGTPWVRRPVIPVEPYAGLVARQAQSAQGGGQADLPVETHSPSAVPAQPLEAGHPLRAPQRVDLVAVAPRPPQDSPSAPTGAEGEPLALRPYALPTHSRPPMVSMAALLEPVDYVAGDWEAREMYEELAEVAACEGAVEPARPLDRLIGRTTMLLTALSDAYR